MDTPVTLSPTKPYLFRAFYEWINDNKCTPYVIVNAEIPDVVVPTEHIHDGRIVLNIALRAISKLKMHNEFVSFSARFSSKWKEIFIPMEAILAIYAHENGQGMVFSEEAMNITPAFEKKSENKTDDQKPLETEPPPKGKPNLRLVKR